MQNQDPEKLRRYDFFVDLFKASKIELKEVSNNAVKLETIYMNRRLEFKIQDDQRAKSWIRDFFSPANFIKRLLIHQREICKSMKMKS